MLAILVVLGLLSGFIVVAARDLRLATLVAVFLLPWSGLLVDIGLQVNAYQIALAALAIVSAVRLTQPGLRPVPVAAGTLLAIFALYAIIDSLLQIGIIPLDYVGVNGLRGPTTRAIVQIPLFLFAISPIILFPLAIRRIADVLLIGRLFVASVVVLAAIGWLQLAVWYATGTNPIPLGAVASALGNNIDVHSGSFALDALNIYRINSFCYEPRDLGVNVMLAMLVIEAYALVAPRPQGLPLAGLWLFLFLTLLATFSTSALGLLIITSAVLVPGCWLFGVRIRRSGRTLIGGALAIVVPLLVLVIGLEAAGVPVFELLAARTVERLTSDGAIEDFDLAIISYLTANPAAALSGVGLGNIHLYATPYLDPLFALYAEGQIFVAKTGYLRFVSELGIIGLGLLLGWYLGLVIAVRRVIPPGSILMVVIPLAGAVLAAAMGSYQVMPQTYALAGGLAALWAIAVMKGPSSLPATGPGLPQPA